jgi:uncharacterized repeat protein (TIGR01451 family)
MHQTNSRWFAAAIVVASTALSAANASGQGAIAKTGFDTSTPANSTTVSSGNTARYVLSVTLPSGTPSAVVISDTVPAGTQYAAGSLKPPPNAIPLWSTDNGLTYVDTEPSPAASVTNLRIEGLGSGLLADRGNVATVPLPVAASISSGSSGGDGYRAIPYNGRVYTVFHHFSNRPLYCADVTTGSTCPGYPANIPAVAGEAFTTDSANGYFLTAGQYPEYINRATGQLYFFARSMATRKIVVVCADLNTQQSCGSYEFSSAPSAPVAASYGMDGGVNGTQLYALTTATNPPTYACYDAATNAPCAGTAADGTFVAGTGFPAAAGGGDYNTGHSLEIGTRMYSYIGVGANRRINCFDMATNAQCGGGNFPLNLPTFGPLFPTANSTGVADGFCVAWDGPGLGTTCFDLNGAPQVKPNLAAALQNRAPIFNGALSQTFGTALLHNGKTYWIADISSIAPLTVMIPSQKFCWDWSTNALCTGFNTTLAPSTQGGFDAFYEMTSDPDRANCLWGLGDSGQIRAFDPRDGSSCGGKTTVQVSMNPSIAYCDGKPHTINWNQIELFGLTMGTDFTSATVTIRDSAGDPVAGFDGVNVPSFPFDISSIGYAGVTTELDILLELNGIPAPIPAAYSADPPPFLTATWTSDPSQMCFDVNVLCAAPEPLNNMAEGTIGNAPVSGLHTFTTVSKAACADVAGRVYLDRDSSGAYNAGANAQIDDLNLTGVDVSMSCTNPTTGPVAATTTASGYLFADIDPGASCTITETQPAQYANAAENADNSIDIASVPAEGSSDNNFGEIAGAVSGRVFNELTTAGIAGQTINLTGDDDSGSSLSGFTTTTAPVGGLATGTLCPSQPALAVGEYYFCDVPLGSSYTVSQPAQPPGTTNGTSSAGSSGGTGSNPTATSSQIASVPVSSANLLAPDNNFGEVQILSSDMTPAFGVLPSAGAPGQVFSGLPLVCTNGGPWIASEPICVPSVPVGQGSISNIVCNASAGSTLTSVEVGGALNCTFTYTASGAPGGGDDTNPSTIIFLAATGATNDSIGGTSSGISGSTCTTSPTTNNCTAADAVIIDALDDTPVAVPIHTVSVVPLLDNDTLDSNAANASDSPNVSVVANGAISCKDCNGPLAALVLNGNGTVTVPKDATPGTYLVPYQICALPANPSPFENACDTAVAIILVGIESVPGLSTFALGVLSLLLVALGITRIRRDF